LATPFIFLAHSGSVLLPDAYSGWWKSLDFLFLGLSFIAIHRATKTTSKTYIKYAFWISWTMLFTVIMNEKMEIFHLPEVIIYPITIVLVLLHFYNQKYRPNKGEKSCIH